MEDVTNVFASCISCFNYALGRAPDDESALRFSLVRLRLTRWGQAVNIYGESGRERDYIDSGDIEKVHKILTNLVAIFKASSTSTQEKGEDFTYNLPTSPSTQVLISMLETIASERSGGINLPCPETSRLDRWRASLVEEASKVVTDLEDYIPVSMERRELWDAERVRFREAGVLELLNRVATERDNPWNNGISVKGIFSGANFGGVVSGHALGSKLNSVQIVGSKYHYRRESNNDLIG